MRTRPYYRDDIVPEKSSSNYAINEILIVLGHGALVSGTSVAVLKSAKKSQLPSESVAVFPLK